MYVHQGLKRWHTGQKSRTTKTVNIWFTALSGLSCSSLCFLNFYYIFFFFPNVNLIFYEGLALYPYSFSIHFFLPLFVLFLYGMDPLFTCSNIFCYWILVSLWSIFSHNRSSVFLKRSLLLFLFLYPLSHNIIFCFISTDIFSQRISLSLSISFLQIWIIFYYHSWSENLVSTKFIFRLLCTLFFYCFIIFVFCYNKMKTSKKKKKVRGPSEVHVWRTSDSVDQSRFGYSDPFFTQKLLKSCLQMCQWW